MHLPLVASRGHSRQTRASSEVVELTKGMLAFGSKNGFDLAAGTRCYRVPGNVGCQFPAMERGGNIQLHPMQWKPYFLGFPKQKSGMHNSLSLTPKSLTTFQFFAVIKEQKEYFPIYLINPKAAFYLPSCRKHVFSLC